MAASVIGHWSLDDYSHPCVVRYTVLSTPYSVQPLGEDEHDDPLRSLIASGTKLWLDSIDPELVARNGSALQRDWGDLESDHHRRLDQDGPLRQGFAKASQGRPFGRENRLASDRHARAASRGCSFTRHGESTEGDDGYVSFELDDSSLLEDPTLNMPTAQRTQKYVELGKQWSAGHANRMIKIPATPAGLAALEELRRAR